MDIPRSGVTVENVENDRDLSTVCTQFDREKTSASMAIIATLAEVMDTDPAELEPLYTAVDPDALDALVGARNGSVGDVHATFTHEEHSISVSSYGTITISQDDELAAEGIESDAGR